VVYWQKYRAEQSFAPPWLIEPPVLTVICEEKTVDRWASRICLDLGEFAPLSTGEALSTLAAVGTM